MMRSPGLKSNRGVALLLALLVTALLLALIFEFAYATRISLRAAQNFRDSERAYFLARSGVNYAAKFLANNKLQDRLPQGEWMTVPVVSAGGTELRIRWEDEKGKIYIGSITNNAMDGNTVAWVDRLFEQKSIGKDVLERMKERGSFRLLSELHLVMGDEDYYKVEKLLTVNSDKLVNINTASEDVLKALGVDPQMIIGPRSSARFSTVEISGIGDVKAPDNTSLLKTYLDWKSSYYTIYSFASVGDYVKQVTAVVQTAGTGFTILYWRSL